MTLRTAQPSILVRTLDVLKELICDCNIVFSPSGVNVGVMDVSSQIYVYANLPKELFEEYRCDGIYPLGVNNTYFHKLIKQATNRDELTLSYHPGRPELGISIYNPAKGSRSVSRLKLLDIDNEYMEIPVERTFNTMVEMNAGDFLKVCRELVSIGSEVVIISDPVEQSITFQTEGDIGVVQQTFLNSEKQAVRAKESAKISDESFNMRPLAMMAKTASISQHVQIFFEEAFPLLLKYSIADKGTIAFCLAPLLNRHRPVTEILDSLAKTPADKVFGIPPSPSH